MPRRTIAVLLAVAVLAAGCGGDDDGGDANPSPPPSGALGPVTQEAAETAFLGLCELQGQTELEPANAIFFDRSHQMLHVIAAATDEVDREVSTKLLVAKQRVESDLRRDALPEAFALDVETLLGATRSAIVTIGLDEPRCVAAG